jgi:predicted RNA-binding protein with TRAM domain
VGQEYHVKIIQVDKYGNGVGLVNGSRVLTDCPTIGVVYRIKIVQVLDKISRGVWLDRPGGPANWPPVEANRVYVLEITGSDDAGHGVANIKGMVVMVKKGKAFVGKKVRVLIYLVQPTFIGGIVYMKDPFPNPTLGEKAPNLATAPS